MEYRNDNLDELLDYIDPAALDYQDWCNVGMALKDAGYDVMVWDAWSARDSARYHSGECEKKWRSFSGSEHPVTAGTIVKMALDNGFQPKKSTGGSALDWNDYIGEDYVVTSPNQVQALPVREPEQWDPVAQITKYIETLFDSGENVGYVTECWQNNDGKYLPTAGCCDRTAGKLLSELAKCGGDIGKVFGDANPECGAWIRFNPLDGKGGKNENPVHEEDTLGVLKDLQTESQMQSYQIGAKRGHQTQSRNAKAKAADKNAELLNTFDAVNVSGDVTVQDLAEYLGVEEKTIRRRIKSCGELKVDKNIVTRQTE